MRIGHGYDVHRLAEGRRLVLGGVEIPHYCGLQGHSDADVLTHAVMDALLGAAGLGDIGSFFPDTDPAYENIASTLLLGKVSQMLAQAGWRIVNVDATVVAQKPKLLPFLPMMRRALAGAMGILPEDIGVKATTEEGLGFTGREEGIAAHAVCLLEKLP
jgi:2-C-methyl-D-erythritol 2,4-cyclodiphosphate synthase